MQPEGFGSMPILPKSQGTQKRVGIQPVLQQQQQHFQSSTNFGQFNGNATGPLLQDAYMPKQNNFMGPGGEPCESMPDMILDARTMPNSVKNIHFNQQYQKGMKYMDKNSRLYSAETTHRYKSQQRKSSQSKAYQTTMSSMQNKGGPVALPDIKVGSGVFNAENLDLNSPQSNDNFHHLFNMSSPSELSSNPDGTRPTTFHQQRKKHGGQPSQQVQQISIEDISPELAAQIVKNFILPMFESDEKKYLKKKYQGLDGVVSPRSSKRQPSQSARDQEYAPGMKPKTVYGELKLSEQLAFQLDELKTRFDNLREQLEFTTYQKESFQRELSILQQRFMERGEKLQLLKKEMNQMRSTLSECVQKCFQLISNGNCLSSFASKSENLRRDYAEQLRASNLEKEQIRNNFSKLAQAKQLNEVKFEIVEEQLKFLYGSIQSLSQSKNLEDKDSFELNTAKLSIQKILEEKQELIDQCRRTTTERDTTRDELKEMTTLIEQIKKTTGQSAKELREQIANLQKEVKELNIDLEKTKDEQDKTTKQNKQLQMERDKMKQRITKLKNRRFRVEDNQKICKKCGKEYLEKENYNWSCKTHQSDWGGELWWCCGKTSKDAPGCKFSKHESKEDDEDEGADPENKDDQHKQLKNVRCNCCKEVGHKIEDCPRDPNMKTNQDPTVIEEDFERIQRIKDFRKLFSDTMVLTTRFLNRCIKVPKIRQKSPNSSMKQKDPANAGAGGPAAVTQANLANLGGDMEKQTPVFVPSFETQLATLKYAPFKRGVMRFEDYNYNLYNYKNSQNNYRENQK